MYCQSSCVHQVVGWQRWLSRGIMQLCLWPFWELHKSLQHSWMNIHYILFSDVHIRITKQAFSIFYQSGTTVMTPQCLCYIGLLWKYILCTSHVVSKIQFSQSCYQLHNLLRISLQVNGHMDLWCVYWPQVWPGMTLWMETVYCYDLYSRIKSYHYHYAIQYPQFCKNIPVKP